MINSLFKDSHIPQTLCRPYFQSSPQNKNRQQDIRLNTTLSKRVNNSIEKPAKQVSFGGFFNPAKDSGILNKLKNLKPIKAIREFDIYKSPRFKKWLEDAESNPLLFGAMFALVLTCGFRPAAIMSMPSDKKNKDDKIYASAHSIASGLIGCTLVYAATEPITGAFKKIEEEIKSSALLTEMKYKVDNGFKPKEDLVALEAKLAKNPTKFLKDKTSYLLKTTLKEADGEVFVKTPFATVASTYIKNIPEFFIAMPRAAVTIALIPVILKYGFGMKKKTAKNDDKMIPILENYSVINQNKLDIKEKSVATKADGGVR